MVPSESRRRAVPVALVVLAASRAAVFLAGYLAVIVFGYPGGRPPVRDFQNELLNLPSRFDARWYLQIANSGYAYDPRAAADVQQNIVFFPAWPMAVRAGTLLLGGSEAASFLAGTVLSLAAFGAALLYLHAFVREIGTDDQADATLWLLAFYPFAIFFGAIYTESLFLLAAIATMFHFRRDEYARAAGWGLVAGLVRPNGFLVAAPLAFHVAARSLDFLRSKRPGSEQGATAGAALAAFAPVAGMLLYSAWIWMRTGHPFTWAEGHAAWGRSYQGIVALVAERYRMIASGGVTGYLATLPHDALNGLGALFALATAWPVARMLGPEYALWMVLNMIPPLSAGGFISAGRFSSVLFPSFVWLASAVRARHRPAWIGLFAALQALCAAMFYTWRPLY